MRGLRALVGSAAGLCMLTLAVAVTDLVTEPPRVPWWQAAAVGLLLLGSLLLRIEVRVRSHLVLFTWIEAAVTVGVLLLPGSLLTALTAAATLLAMLVQRMPPTKLLLNTSAITVAAGLSALVFALVADGSGSGATILLAAIAASACYSAVTDLAVSSAVALSQGLRIRDVVADGAVLQLLTTLGNVATAVGVVALLQWQPVLLLALPPLLVAVHSAYRNRASARLERETWQRLASATSRLVSLPSDEVAGAAEVDLQQFLAAESVEVQIGLDLPSAAPSERSAASSYVIEHPLRDAGGSRGRILLRYAGRVALTDRETAALSTYASALTSALRNAALHAEQRHAMLHDPLTGLANRRMLAEEGERILARHASPPDGGLQPVTALLLLDLDHFKEVNDALGHHSGDLVLQAVSARLQAATASEELVARLGGDEFAVLLPGLSDPGDALVRARQLARALTEPTAIDGLPVSVEASVGIACAPQDGATVPELLRRADVAMYHAKNAGTGCALYRRSHDESSVERVGLLAELRRALREDELELHYQVQLDLDGGHLTGVEALVRWNHPTRGQLGPVHFVPHVEVTGLIGEFTLHVLDLALAEAARWRRAGCVVPVAVNLSARALLDRDLPTRVQRLLRVHDVPASQLVLEITETAALSQLDVVEKVLLGLAATGAALSVDDFGTGYSSLTFLSRTTLHELKIDKSFTAGMLTSERDAAIVRATVNLARSFGLRVVAEGIENGHQLRALRGLGCTSGQGYLLGRPVPAAELHARLVREAAAPGAEAPAETGEPTAAVTGLPVPRRRSG